MTQRHLEDGPENTPPDIASGFVPKTGTSESVIRGFKRNYLKTGFVYFFYVITCFLLWLVFHWKPEWKLYCTHDECSLARAECVMIKDPYNRLYVHEVILMTEDGTSYRYYSFLHIITQRIQLAQAKSMCADCIPDNHTCHVSSATPLLDPFHSKSIIRFFMHKKLRYIWSSTDQSFNKLSTFDSCPCNFFHQTFGLNKDDSARKRVLFGDNAIAIPLTPLLNLLVKEALHPFYVFQLFSVLLWYNDDYAMYATCIVVISVLSIAVSIYEMHRNEINLRKTLVSSNIVSVQRGLDSFEAEDSEVLVPGDIIEIPKNGCVMQCDAILISGNCIVNESMLTGESVPVLKTPLADTRPVHSGKPRKQSSEPKEELFSMKEHGRHILFCGTKVIQTRFVTGQRVKAVVVQTGFMTSKGEMVRSILFPKPMQFKFNKDILHYLIVLGFFALIGFIYTVIIMLHRDYFIGKIILRALDLITIIVPPALPAAMTVGIVFAQNRLKKVNIFCISPNTINICGGVNTVCFDKTGTLTEDGLDLWGVLAADGDRFSRPVQDPSKDISGPLIEAMASCHTLTRISNELSGDPLDLIMFQSTGWELEEPESDDHRKFDLLVSTIVRPPRSTPGMEDIDLNDPNTIPFEVGILRLFPFSSSLQRMSVVARKLGADHFTVYVKGSPEMIQSLSRPESLPKTLNQQLMHYTRQGYRVLALAYKPLRVSYLKVQKIARDVVEKDLNFLGLLIMENRLKKETTPVIHTLLNANIRPVMVTGDNMLTALSVARDCDIIGDRDSVIVVQGTPPVNSFPAQVDFHYAGDLKKKVREVVPEHALAAKDPEISIKEGNYHLAMSGKTWEIICNYFPSLVPKLVVKGAVFARFSPDQKAQLVEALQSVGYTVAMCGDGANDCGALKSAHAGVSLSEAEASIASPFTSKEQNISCVPKLIMEGRCALTTSFGTFKFMAGYSMTQFVSCLILYWIGCNLTDGQFLYIDLFVITSLGISFGYTKAYPQLHREPPSMRLMSIITVCSITLQCGIMISAQAVAYLYMQMQPWFLPFHMDIEADEYASYENTAVFLVSSYQYITLAIIFSKSAPYRKPIFTNYIFLANLVIAIGANLYVSINPFPWLKHFLELWDTPEGIVGGSFNFKVLTLGFVLLNFLFAYLVEECIEAMWLRVKWRHVRRRVLSKGHKEYERIKEELHNGGTNWPPLSRAVSFEDMTRTELFGHAHTSLPQSKTVPHHLVSHNDPYAVSDSDEPSGSGDLPQGHSQEMNAQVIRHNQNDTSRNGYERIHNQILS